MIQGRRYIFLPSSFIGLLDFLHHSVLIGELFCSLFCSFVYLQAPHNLNTLEIPAICGYSPCHWNYYLLRCRPVMYPPWQGALVCQ